jgi:hypothetical protein
MAQRELSILLTLKDQASKELAGFEGKLESLQPTFKKMAVAGTAAFAAVTGVVVTTTKAFQEQERAEARLSQIAKQVTGSTNEEIKAFKTLASELQKVGVVGDEVLIAGQSQIASFAKSSETVSILTKDIADLAVAQYGVNVSQEQAIQTANLLGKALQGQLGALTRTGVLVSEDFKTAFEEANTEIERAAVISQIVQDNYGGLNEAMRQTSEGGAQALKNSFGDMQEVIGGALIPVLNDLVKKITPVIDRIAKWVEANPELTRNILLGVGALGGLVAVLGTLGLILLPLIATLKVVGVVILALTSPIGLVVAAIVGLGIAAYALWKNWDEVWGFIKKASLAAYEWIKSKTIDPLVKAFERIVAVINRVKDGISSITGGAVSKVTGAVSSTIGRLTSVNDAIISPKGDIITTHPDDYLIATKTPGSLGGGGVTVNITGGTFYGLDDMAEQVGDAIIRRLSLSSKLAG